MNNSTPDTDNPHIEYSVIPADDPGKADEGALALDRFLAELTTHEVSEHKAGSGWVPGVFSGPRRTILNTARITCLVGDIDGTGPDIDEAAEILRMSGLKCALVTSYRHGMLPTEEEVKHAAKKGATLDPAKPLNKYRVIAPFAQALEVPQGDQIAFNEKFKRGQTLALHYLGFEGADTASLGLEHYFYDPRCPAEPGLPPFGQVFEGELLDFNPFMEQAERELATDATGTRKAASNGAARPCEREGLHVRAGHSQDVIDPITCDEIPLDVWLGKYREGLQMHTMIAAAVQAGRWPAAPVKSTTNAKHVICCPNADSHTPQQAPDKGAFAWNASDFAQTTLQGNQRGGLQCSHAHCADDYGADSPGHTGTDDLKLLALALEQGWVDPTDFADKANYTPEILLKVSEKADSASSSNSRERQEERSNFRLIPLEEAIANVKPPEYIIKPMLQRGHLSTLTGQVQSGKTSVMIALGMHVAAGRKLLDMKVKQGPVIMFLGENPTDVINRLKVACKTQKFPETLPISVVDRVVNINNIAKALREEINRLGIEPMLVIVDTLAKYIPDGADENSTTDMKGYTTELRESLCELPGRPCVLIPSHPRKYADGEDQLLPRGSSAIWADIDDNFTVWKEPGENVTKLHFEKIRGSRFMEPVYFELEEITDQLKTADGEFMSTVVARPLTDKDHAARTGRLRKDHILVLLKIAENEKAPLSISEIAHELCWKTPDHEPHKSKVHRSLRELLAKGLVEKQELSDKYIPTAVGRKRAKALEKEMELGI